jgi:hypothetical protein
MVPLIHAVLTEAKNAFYAVLPGFNETLASQVEPIMRRWNAQGAALIAGVKNWSEPEVLVDEATVLVLHPVLGGGGNAHLPYNMAAIEAVVADPVPALSEMLRLAWLLSMLNLDLPRYSENVATNRVVTVASLAMIPIVLAGAEAVPLAKCDEETIRLAVRTWMTAGDEAGAWPTALLQWWEVYKLMRPPIATALEGLDQLLKAQRSGPL